MIERPKNVHKTVAQKNLRVQQKREKKGKKKNEKIFLGTKKKFREGKKKKIKKTSTRLVTLSKKSND